MIQETGFIMAFGAGHILMAGRSPGIHIDIHLVAEATEGRTFSKSENGG
jgi:hypothetical protein